jgi:hypothetical protein
MFLNNVMITCKFVSGLKWIGSRACKQTLYALPIIAILTPWTGLFPGLETAEKQHWSIKLGLESKLWKNIWEESLEQVCWLQSKD